MAPPLSEPARPPPRPFGGQELVTIDPETAAIVQAGLRAVSHDAVADCARRLAARPERPDSLDLSLSLDVESDGRDAFVLGAEIGPVRAGEAPLDAETRECLLSSFRDLKFEARAPFLYLISYPIRIQLAD